MRVALLLAFLGSALLACGGTKATPPSAESAPVAAPAPPPPAAAAPTPTPALAQGAPAATVSDRVEEAAFELHVAPVGTYAAGKLASFALTIEPRGEWHLNQDFPTEVTVKGGEGVALPSVRLDKKSAAEFGDELARFDVPFTAKAAGAHEVECNVRFAVCSAENCIPEERTVALALRVD